MKFIAHHQWVSSGLFVVLVSIVAIADDKASLMGPETEKRFPPLTLPAGFRATLFACDPLIEYPSAIALGQRRDSVFVAIDYMTGLGTEIVRRDEIRLVEDTNGDGYADRAIVYATGFNSIQGLTFHDGTVYVMHAPFLTSLRDSDGDGKAEERRDLLSGLGLTPEENPVRLHCANGLVMGYDGWLYLALGDHGCSVTRPEGDRLVLHGGGILRCRADGRDLHLFASGLRNIYDVALDEDLNVFVRDNENDGGDYKIRVCHSFFGADHGYPYLYYEGPNEALAPLADLGLGSSAGGLCYLEHAFPADYRRNLFFCEWGRSVVRYSLQRADSGFAPTKQIEFAAGAQNDPYGFKPTDLVVDRAGALFVADWADGQRPKRGRGRIYRITWPGDRASAAQTTSTNSETAKAKPNMAAVAQSIAQLNSESYNSRLDGQTPLGNMGREGKTAINEALRKGHLGVRARKHAVWILAKTGERASLEDLFNLLKTDPDPSVRVQAVRALADLTDPALTQHRLDARTAENNWAIRIAALIAGDSDARVRLEGVVALGRLQWPGVADWLRDHVRAPDGALAHAAMQTLRRSGNWPAVLKLVDEADEPPIRGIALRALSNRAEPEVVDGLIDRLQNEKVPARRREYTEMLTRVHKRPAAWTYWGYRPPPRPANTVAWEKTEAIDEALDHALASSDRPDRPLILRAMQREKVPVRLATLAQWLKDERGPEAVAAILESLRNRSGQRRRDLLADVIKGRDHGLTNRLAALTLFSKDLDNSNESGLLDLARSTEDGAVLAETLREIARHPLPQASAFLLSKLGSPEPMVRAAALDCAAQLRVTEAIDSVRDLLRDPNVQVRRAAAAAAGILGIRPAVELLLDLAKESDPALRRASLDSLRLLKEPRGLELATLALNDRETQSAALRCIEELGGPGQVAPLVALARHDRSASVLSATVRLLTKWSAVMPSATQREMDGTVAELQGLSGILLRWKTSGPMRVEAASELFSTISRPQEEREESREKVADWPTSFATGAEARLLLRSSKSSEAESVFLGLTDVKIAEATAVQFLASSRGPFRVWLNGRLLHQRDDARNFVPDSERFEGALAVGLNRVLVQVNSRGDAEFHVRIRRKGSTAEHERLVQAALSRPGNVERGRKVFFDIQKSQCLKCHRLAGQGEQIGPELTGIGNRFSRIHIVESILEPSRTIAPSFQLVEFVLNDGRELSGVIVSEGDGVVTIADTQGQKHPLARSAVKEQRTQSLSAMPEGLEKAFSTEEFIDLIEFLANQTRQDR